MAVKEAISKVVDRKNLTFDEAYSAMFRIMSGEVDQAQIAAFLVGLRMKGETVDEIAGCARAMREKALKINSEYDVIDTCGTGGDLAGTFNISTATAIVASAAGANVAKHGNRAVSSKCGSADVLQELGVNIELGPEEAEKCLNEIGITFIFAPIYHKAMKYAAPVRKSLGIRTIFNILGPLTNPAGAKRQLLGVFSADLTEKLAYVLAKLGSEMALVVHGAGGIDEISIAGTTRVSELKNGEIKTYEIKPEDFGIERATINSILGGDSKQNAEIILDILNGKKSPHRDVVVLNSGAAIYVAGLTQTLGEGIEMAKDVIDSGKAKRKLEELIEFTNNIV